MIEVVAAHFNQAYEQVSAELNRLLWIFAFFLAAERFLAAEKGQDPKLIFFNLKHTVLYHSVVALLVTPLVAMSIVATVRASGVDGLIKLNLLEPAWLAVLSPVIFLFVIDGFYYVFHRLQHELPFLWEQHKLHHSDEAVNVTTTERQHWTENLFKLPIIYLPMALLFDIEKSTAGMLAFLTSYWAFFIHSNLNVQLGPLSALIGGPQVHRIHHSKLDQHLNKNYAAFFPIYDVLFGTYYHPAKNEFPPTGLASGEKVDSMWRAFILPFIGWSRSARQLLGRPRASDENERIKVDR